MTKFRILILAFFLLLFGGYYAASSFFYHTHLIGGVSVVHSHPYSDQDEGHSHSQNEFVFYMVHSLTMAWLLIEAFSLFRYRKSLWQTNSFLSVPAILTDNIAILPQRGPPFLK
jgi:hypothetical protein